MSIGFHASHEQFSPSELLHLTKAAESAGFSRAMSSDHISPWMYRQGHSGHSWSWLGAAMQATEFSFGALSIPGGWRYHPVVLAQAVATLAELFPDRLAWIAAGSGEAMNESVTGNGWPDKQERHERLLESVAIMRALWRGETITKNNGYIKADHARLWSLPKTFPLIYGAALTNETARWAGSWADGLITIRKSVPETKQIMENFAEGGGKGKPFAIQMHISWDRDEETARQSAWDQWKFCLLSPQELANVKTPDELEAKTRDLSMDEIGKHVLISTEAEYFIERIKEYRALGIDEIFVHNTGKNQKEFIDFFGKNVIPCL